MQVETHGWLLDWNLTVQLFRKWTTHGHRPLLLDVVVTSLVWIDFPLFSRTWLIDAADGHSLPRRSSRINSKLIFHFSVCLRSPSIQTDLLKVFEILFGWNRIFDLVNLVSTLGRLIFQDFLKLGLFFVYLAYVLEFGCAIKASFIARVTAAQIFKILIRESFRNSGFIFCYGLNCLQRQWLLRQSKLIGRRLGSSHLFLEYTVGWDIPTELFMAILHMGIAEDSVHYSSLVPMACVNCSRRIHSLIHITGIVET